MASSRRDPAPRRPDRIGRYPVLGLLGRGGMGEVWLARDEDLGRQVAIKILKSRRAQDPVWLARFKREAQAVSSLEHPYIVPVYEFGEDEGRRFFVMRAVEGNPLNLFVRQLRWSARDDAAPESTQRGSALASTSIADEEELRRAGELTVDPDAVTTAASATDNASRDTAPDDRRTSLSLGGASGTQLTPAAPDDGGDIVVVLELIEKCARALAFAHRRGVLHRDVKPSNIMVDLEGNPQLLDFGLARVVGTEELSLPRRPRRGAIIGTLPYVAPEHFGGEDDAIDHRADIYALGVTLYESLCGVRPFVAETAEDLMFKIVGRDPDAPRELRDGISRDLETVMLKALEKDPDHRYQTAEEFAQDLNNLRFLREIDARPVTRAMRVARWANRRPLLASLLALLLVAAIVGPTVFAVNQVRGRAERARVERYTRHVRRAQDHETAREALLADIAKHTAELARLEKETPTEAPAEGPAKRALFALRARLREERAEAARLAGRMEYELQLSREAVDPYAPDDAERVSFYRRLHAEARARGDLGLEERSRLFLTAAGVDPDADLDARLSLATSPPGALVTLFPVRAGDDGRRLLVKDEAEALGTTPLVDRRLRPGHWHLRLELAGHHPVEYPITLAAGEHWGHADFAGGRFAERDWTVRLLPLDHHASRDWAQVPRGPYRGGPEGDPDPTAAASWRWVEGFLMAREEVTFDDYLDFLDRPETLERLFAHREAIRRDPEAVRAAGLRAELILIPRRTESASPVLGVDGASRRIVFPPAETEPLFGPEVALMGVSKHDAEDFVRWLAKERGLRVRLPRQDEWQKAARGTDGRRYPWGDDFDWSFLASRGAEALRDSPRAYPHPPRSFPADISPYGIFDLAGNVSEWCADGPVADDPRSALTWYSGGAYAYGRAFMYLARPWNAAPYEYVSETLGLRLVRDY